MSFEFTFRENQTPRCSLLGWRRCWARKSSSVFVRSRNRLIRLSSTLRGLCVAMHITPSSFRHVGRDLSAKVVKEASARSVLKTHPFQQTRRRVPSSCPTRWSRYAVMGVADDGVVKLVGDIESDQTVHGQARDDEIFRAVKCPRNTLRPSGGTM